MARSDRQRVADILEAIADIRDHTVRMRREDFAADRKTQNAVLYCVGVNGEAARLLSDTVKARSPEISWIDVVNIRHRVAHEYFRIDVDLIWKVIKDDLEPLEAALRKASPDE